MTQIIEIGRKLPISLSPQNLLKLKTKFYNQNNFVVMRQYGAIEAKAISTMTNSGYTAFQLSAWRPSTAHILVSNRRILTQLSFTLG
jgi:pyruvate kinase